MMEAFSDGSDLILMDPLSDLTALFLLTRTDPSDVDVSGGLVNFIVNIISGELLL